MDDGTLNPNQLVAATHLEGPLLVLAGAGSGKTRIVTQRVAHLIKMGIPPSEILAVTFTNKAAGEMQSRIAKLCQKKILACTFHSLGVRILRESMHHLERSNDFIIYDEEDSLKLLKVCIKTAGIKDEKSETKRLHNEISVAKNALRHPADISDENEELKKVYTLYQEALKEYNALDFDDLLFLTVQLLQEHPDVLAQYQRRFRFLLIDEYQDTNLAQYTLTRLLVATHHNIFAVGDPDQSIYSWRGANIQNILNFKSDFPGATVITLEQNYRSRNNILQAANALIENNQKRYEKRLWSNRAAGEPIELYICESDRAEAQFIVDRLLKHQRQEGISLNECVVFYRTNSQSRTIEDALLKYRVPYQIVGGLSFYQRREIKDLLAFLRLLVTDYDYLAFMRTINLPKRGLGEASLVQLKQLSEEQNLSILATCRRAVNGEIAAKLSAKQREGVAQFIQSIDRLRMRLAAKLPLKELLSELITEMGYLSYLKEDPESYEDRRSNVAELLSKAAEWEREAEVPELQNFLEELSLKSSAEESQVQDEQVRLMTLHNGKGLEFQVVFISGMEEEIFPHINSRDTEAQIEEERRLCYVGMTRAKDHLYLTAARQRYLWGTARLMRPSRFLKEIPTEFLKATNQQFVHHPSRPSHEEYVPDPEEQELFRVGSSLVHKDFGKGTLKEISESVAMGPIYTIHFIGDDRPRKLIARLAKLRQVQN